MDLQIKNQLFVVGGAGSGFGKAIATGLAQEGAKVLAVSRTRSKLLDIKERYPDSIAIIDGDITHDETHQQIAQYLEGKSLSGVVMNGGGPPAGNFSEVSLEQWQAGWRNIVEWKIALTYKLMPYMLEKAYGRMVFIESVSVKQMVPNLILSNALRPAIVGFVKTLSREVAGSGVNVNVLAPGYHLTPALERLFIKKS